jgi:hypothetical protein
MIDRRIGFALFCAAVAMPAGANRLDADAAASPLAIAIAMQGDQALRDIRHDARLCLQRLKPAPLETLINVQYDAPRGDVAQLSL